VRWPTGRPGSFTRGHGLAARTLAQLLPAVGRVVLWALIALLLVRGAADVIAGERSGTASERGPLRSPAVWPDEPARAFAASFARACLSFAPGRREQHARELARFMAPELAAAAMPELVGRGDGHTVVHAVSAGTTRLDADRALVTVAVALARDPGVRYLAVPVGRDEHGGLVVYDLPSFVAAPARGIVDLPESAPLVADERAELEGVLTRFLRSFLAGDSAGLEYLVPAGEHVQAVSPPLELVGVDGIALLVGGGDRRVVAVELRARDASSGAVYRLRYRVALMRAGRWFVASVNASPEGRLR
jgi:hypothetical protein